MNIGYASQNDYIVTLEILDDIIHFPAYDDLTEEEINNSTYITKSYNVLKVQNFNGEIIDYPHLFPIINYYKTYERAQMQTTRNLYFEQFMEIGHNSSEFQTKKYTTSGIYKDYDNWGVIKCEFYHNNGIIEGMVKHYYTTGHLEAEIFFVNNVKKYEKIYNWDGTLAKYIKY